MAAMLSRSARVLPVGLHSVFLRGKRLLNPPSSSFVSVPHAAPTPPPSRWATLIGPPEIYAPPPPTPTPTPNPSTGDQFMDLMSANFNSTTTDPLPPKGLTENMSPTYLSSGDPFVDFFFQVVPGIRPGCLHQLLESAWERDPLTALKLVCQLRGVRDKGKSDKRNFYTAALWIHQHHPKTLALNIKCISQFGYLKDMPEILFRLLNGHDYRWKSRTPPKRREDTGDDFDFGYSYIRASHRLKMLHDQKKEEKKKEKAVEKSPEKVKEEKEAVRELRKKKELELAKRALHRYTHDPNYQFLFHQISECFAELLRWDMESLKSEDQRVSIGLAAKWCPSLESSYDRHTLLCEAIARCLFPRESHPEYAELEEAHYAYRIRDRLRKEVLVPLRAELELPEVYMSDNKWDILPYTRVASVAISNYKEHFEKHDGERFAEFLGRVKKGEVKIAAGALLPHQIMKDAGSEVADLQWKQMVADVAEKGKMSNCLAVCDVSGSMSGEPMEVCIALGMLLSELCEEPWKGKVITFSANPQLHTIKGETLKEKMNFVRRMDWGMNTNFQKVFDKILAVAKNGKLPEENMIKRVFVFSDMEFDEASANPWETDYEAIERKFRESGYSGPPEIVFWNLRPSRSTPVHKEQKGVALVSGFSKNQLKLLMDEGNIVTFSPKDVMLAAISGDEYEGLVIYD